MTDLNAALRNRTGSSPLAVVNSAKGWIGEIGTAGHLDRMLHDDPDRHVLHDVRLSSEDRKCQIDHLIVAPGRLIVLETKNYEGVVVRDGRDRWAIVSHEMNVTPIGSPSAQVTRAAVILDRIMEDAGTSVVVNPVVVFGPLSIVRLAPVPGAPTVVVHSRLGDWLRDLVAATIPREAADRTLVEAVLRTISRQTGPLTQHGRVATPSGSSAPEAAGPRPSTPIDHRTRTTT